MICRGFNIKCLFVATQKKAIISSRKKVRLFSILVAIKKAGFLQLAQGILQSGQH